MDLTTGQFVTVNGVTVRLEGSVSRAEVTPGGSGLTIRGTRGDDVISDLLAGSGLRLSGSVDIDVRQFAAPSRGDTTPVWQSRPRLVLDPPPLGADETTHVALVEQDGELRWVFAEPSSNRFVVDIDTDQETERGYFGSALRQGVMFLAVKAIKPVAGRTARSLVGRAEERLRPTRVRTFTATDYRNDNAGEPNGAELAKGPALLLIHGTNSRASHAFGGFDPQWLTALQARYGGQVFAFDHPTLSVSPTQNADDFARWVNQSLPPGSELELDVLAHSRGGLVARELVERPRPGISVRSIVFVASPNNGTPLCDAAHLGSFVDILTNLAAVIPDNPVTDSLEVLFELVKQIALDIVYDSLPGIEAMSPTGHYLETLNRSARPAGVEYRAIAADFEPLNTSARLVKLRDRLFDRVFNGAMNDLVVPTRSPYLRSGAFAVPADHRVVLDSSHSVHHAGYWNIPDVLSRLDDWLRPDWPVKPPAPTDPATSDPNADVESAMARANGPGLTEAVKAFQNLPATFAGVAAQIAGGPVATPPSAEEGLGAVVVLPGIMGSLLDTDEGRIWISPWRLSRGGFETLALSAAGPPVKAIGLNSVYAPLAARLAQMWEVHLFPFDWRRDINEAADALDHFITGTVMGNGNKRAVHLVAHSMGGLVARAFIGRHHATWEAMDDGPSHRKGGRLVMLGTPNRGSYAIALALAGHDTLVKGVAAIDREHDRNQLRAILATFPGIYQMLPSPGLAVDDEHHLLYEPAAWGEVPVDPQLLKQGKDFHQWLEQEHPGSSPERMVFVAGDRQKTPARIRLVAGTQHLGSNDLGDGRVLHQSGALDGVRYYYVDTSHGGLVNDTSVLDTIDELLQTGTTTSLRHDRLPRRGDAVGPDDRSTTILGPNFDPDPQSPMLNRGNAVAAVRRWRDAAAVLDQATALYLGTRAQKGAGHPALRIRVTHASLEQAAHPVIVGHYGGIPLAGAEGVLDYRLDRALSRHHAVGDYPRQVGETLYVESPHQHPKGGIVIGLGDFGDLTRSRLTRAVARAVVQRTLRAVERQEKGPIGVSAVLVSTPGGYGLTVEATVAALVEGVARSLVDLASQDPGAARVEELQIIELYEVRANQAISCAMRVTDMLPVDVQASVDLHLPDQLELGRGGRPGLPSFDSSSGGWPRFVVDRKAPSALPGNQNGDRVASPSPALARLEFTRLGRGAQIDRLSVAFDPDKVNRSEEHTSELQSQ